MKRSRAGDAENIFDACMADVLAEETGTDRDQRERALEEVGLVAQAVEEARAEDAEVSYAAWRKENLLPVIYPSGEPEDLDRPSSPLAPSASSSSDHEQQPSRAAPQTSHGSAIPSHGMNQLVQEQQLMMQHQMLEQMQHQIMHKLHEVQMRHAFDAQMRRLQKLERITAWQQHQRALRARAQLARQRPPRRLPSLVISPPSSQSPPVSPESSPPSASSTPPPSSPPPPRGTGTHRANARQR